MPTEVMTYDELAVAWGVSREAARKKVEGLRLPKMPGNDGKVRVTVDLAEVQHTPLPKRPKPDRSPPGDRPETDALERHIERLERDLEAALLNVENERACAAALQAEVVALRAEAAVVPTLREVVTKAEAAVERERDRAERLERVLEEARAAGLVFQAEAACAPALRQTVEALKGALDSERDRARDLRAERDRFLRDLEQQMTRRSWWPFRRAG